MPEAAANPLWTGGDGKSTPAAGEANQKPSDKQRTSGGAGAKTCWIITVIVFLVAIALAVGIGVGVSQSKKDDDDSAPAPPPPVGSVANLTLVKNKLLKYIPVDIQQADTDELVANYVAQVARIQPVADLLAAVLPVLGANTSLGSSVVQPQAIQMYVSRWLESQKVDGSSLAATLDSLAQLAQGVPDWQSQLLPIARNLGNITALVRSNVDRLLNSSSALSSSGRRLMQDKEVTEVVKAAVRSVLDSDAAAPFVSVLREVYDPASLPDLAAALFTVGRRLVGASSELRDLMERLDQHLDLDLVPSLPIFNPRTGLNLSTVVDLVPFDKRTTIVLSPAARRRLQAADPLAAALKLPATKLPGNFTAASFATLPRVMVPLVFHVMTYSQSSGSYGPPNWDKTPDYVARLVTIANNMAYRTNFQFFVNEIRYQPANNPYLLKADRASWMACAAKPNYFYLACADVLKGAVDHPRSINIFIVGDKADASYAGYGWVPSSASDISRGHIALLWSVLDAGQWNSQSGWEYGGKVLWHELMHHLGLYHTFGKGNSGSGCSTSSDDGVSDTPIVAGAVYNQASFSSSSREYCLNYFNRDLGSSWARVNEAWRTRLGIPTADSSHTYDSCPTLAGVDELGNYIAYTHDVCIAALGHQTLGQALLMHNTSSRTQRTLYQWGQYLATLSPGTFNAPPPPPLPSPPPPPSPIAVIASPPPPPASPPPPPPLSACLLTRSGCKCRRNWSWNGQDYTGCGRPDSDPVGLWCFVEQDGSCPSAINGFWDYCPATATEALCGREFPRPPSPPPARPPPPLVPCGANHVTVSGSICSREPWAYTAGDGDYNATYLGCANPDNDPQGSWCRLQPGFTSLLGRTWDYCGPVCNDDDGNRTASGPSSAANCVASQGLPAGCSCVDAWGTVLRTSSAAVGRKYATARHCTVLPELAAQVPAGSGVCEVAGCNAAALNGRVVVCSSPCTTMTAADGDDVEL